MFFDHSLTASGLALLKIVQALPLTAEQVATQVSYPLYRVRIGLTELTDARLLLVQAGLYQLTKAGLLQLTA